jgi:hypothetical protein
VTKVQHKPIKSPRYGSKRKEQNQPKAALIWRTGLSGVPLDSVWCTRVDQLELATFGFLEKPLCYNSSDCPVCHAEQRLQCQRSSPKGEQCATAHRTVNRTCLVHHRTVWWSQLSELQRSNPNGWVTWLAQRTVSGGAPDCPVRPSTDSLPNSHFGGWGYKYRPTTTL